MHVKTSTMTYISHFCFLNTCSQQLAFVSAFCEQLRAFVHILEFNLTVKVSASVKIKVDKCSVF